MNKSRRLFLLGGSAATVSLLSGCATPALWEDNHIHYSEEVSSVLISQGKKQLVFLGKDYHYIFDAPSVLVATLQSDIHSLITAAVDKFTVEMDGSIHGIYTLMLSEKAPAEYQQAAQALGFKRINNADGTGRYIYSDMLHGKRYRSGGIVPAESQKLNKVYTANVTAPQSLLVDAGKVLLTPITLTVDGVLVIGAIPLAAVFIGIVAANGGLPRC